MLNQSQVRFTANIHGDEAVCRELLIGLARLENDNILVWHQRFVKGTVWTIWIWPRDHKTATEMWNPSSSISQPRYWPIRTLCIKPITTLHFRRLCSQVQIQCSWPRSQQMFPWLVFIWTRYQHWQSWAWGCGCHSVSWLQWFCSFCGLSWWLEHGKYWPIRTKHHSNGPIRIQHHFNWPIRKHYHLNCLLRTLITIDQWALASEVTYKNTEIDIQMYQPMRRLYIQINQWQVTFPWDDSPACSDSSNAVCSEDSVFYDLALNYAYNHSFMFKGGFSSVSQIPFILGRKPPFILKSSGFWNFNDQDVKIIKISNIPFFSG